MILSYPKLAGWKMFTTFTWGICLKMNVMVRLEFELTQVEAAVKPFSHYITDTHIHPYTHTRLLSLSLSLSLSLYIYIYIYILYMYDTECNRHQKRVLSSSKEIVRKLKQMNRNNIARVLAENMMYTTRGEHTYHWGDPISFDKILK